MKLLDVVAQFQAVLPKHTELLSSVLRISSITASGNSATIATSERHGLTDGQAITITGVQSQNPISSITQDGLIFTVTTSQEHDLTYGWEEHDTVTFAEFTDSAWNDSFDLIGVDTKYVFRIRSTNSLPTLNGNEVLYEMRADGINGRYQANVVSQKSFTITGTFNDGIYTGGTVSGNVRVAGSVTIERAIEQYTKKNVEDVWGFVVMNDAEVSKARTAHSDATATVAMGQDIRVRMLDGFSITYVVNTSNDISAQQAVDVCRHDLLLPTLQSVYGARFDTGLSKDMDFRTIPKGHFVSAYNRAILAYTYDFEVVMDLTADDSINQGNDRAFRDIGYTQIVGDDDTTDLTVTVNLPANP